MNETLKVRRNNLKSDNSVMSDLEQERYNRALSLHNKYRKQVKFGPEHWPQNARMLLQTQIALRIVERTKFGIGYLEGEKNLRDRPKL